LALAVLTGLVIAAPAWAGDAKPRAAADDASFPWLLAIVGVVVLGVGAAAAALYLDAKARPHTSSAGKNASDAMPADGVPQMHPFRHMVKPALTVLVISAAIGFCFWASWAFDLSAPLPQPYEGQHFSMPQAASPIHDIKFNGGQQLPPINYPAPPEIQVQPPQIAQPRTR
jgi:hypothetical protein